MWLVDWYVFFLQINNKTFLIYFSGVSNHPRCAKLGETQSIRWLRVYEYSLTRYLVWETLASLGLWNKHASELERYGGLDSTTRF